MTCHGWWMWNTKFGIEDLYSQIAQEFKEDFQIWTKQIQETLNVTNLSLIDPYMTLSDINRYRHIHVHCHVLS